MPESAARDFRASRWIKAEPERWLLVVRKPFQDPKQRLQTYVAARGWLTGWGKRIVTGSTSKGERSTYGRRELAVTLDGSPLLVISHEENDVLEASSLKADARGWPAIDFDLLDPIGICSTLLEKFERRYEDRSGPPHIWRPELSVAIYESWPMLSDQFEPFLAEVARAMAHEVDGVT